MDAKDEVKQRLSVEEVIGDYLELRRAGRNFKALSPFSSEKTPSFMVSPEKQIWHDFSSNKGGDIFSFIMEVEGVDFKEALEILARKAGVDLSQYQKQGDGKIAQLKKRLLAAHVQAAQFYHLCLSKKLEALAYIKDTRHFTADTIRQWQLGYSPDNGKALYLFLKKRGFSEEELSKAGLITRRRDGWGDMFRGRIMIPLADGQGNIVGFTARLLKDNKDAPKYFNTPQTLIYDKGRQVFGLHHAKDAIRKSDTAVLVEGNLDVIASHQAGISHVVAAAGTAMTADHLRSLNRLTSRVVLAFDADKAGLLATERAIPIAQSVGVELSVVVLPEGVKDPDELIQKDTTLWQQQIDTAIDATSWVLNRYEQLYDRKTAAGKRELSTKALQVIRGLQDPVEREHHLKQVASQLGVSEQSLLSKLMSTKSAQKPKKQVHIVDTQSDKASYEDDFLALNAYYPDVRESLSLVSVTQLRTDVRRDVFELLKSLPVHQRLEPTVLQAHEDYGKILLFTAEQKYASWNPADIMAEAMALARRIVAKTKKQNKEELIAAIRKAEEEEDLQEVARLLDSYQQLLNKE
jgi:DNA primase